MYVRHKNSNNDNFLLYISNNNYVPLDRYNTEIISTMQDC